MVDKKYIELHRKIGKRFYLVYLKVDQILMVSEDRRGTAIKFLMRSDWIDFATIFVKESYDEVVRLLADVN